MKPPKEIQRIDSIEKTKFYQEYVAKNRPVIITGLTNDWPATNKWDFSYLQESFKDVEATTIPVKDGNCDFNLENGVVTSDLSLGKTIHNLKAPIEGNGIAIATTDDSFPSELRADYWAPVYCKNGRYLRVRVFIGSSGTATWLHQDLFENLYTMVRGSKEITLFTPKESVYPQSRFSKLPNFAKPNMDSVDFSTFPKMKSVQPYVVTLNAGETLYLPSLWWHHLKNTDESIAISHWWAYGWKLPIVWAAAKYKKIRSM